MKQLFLIFSFALLFLVGFVPSRGSVYADGQNDSLPIRVGVRLTTDGQKRAQIYHDQAGADSLYRQAIAKDSLYSPAYYLLAQSFLTRRVSVDSAVYYAQKAYALDSLNKWYSESYAQALALGGDYEKSRSLYEDAIKRDPQNLNGYIMVAMLYDQTSKSDQALAVLDSAEVRTGKSAYISSLKREILLSKGETEKAIEQAIEIVELDPTEIKDRLVLADLYVATKQDSLALQQYNAALKIDSMSTVVLNVVAQYHAERGNYPAYFAAIKRIFSNPEESLEGKIATFRRVTSDRAFYGRNLFSISELATQLYLLYPTNKQVVELYARHLIDSGALDRALEIYKLHTKDEPVQYDYYEAIIDIESYKQRVDSVELYAARALKIFPDRHELHLAQANVYSYTKRYDDAIDLYNSVVKTIPNDTLRGKVYGYIGDNYHQKSLLAKQNSYKAKSMMRKAYKSYDKSLEVFPSNAMVLNNYAYFLSLEQRNLEKALDLSGRAIALEESNSTYLDTYAWVLYELGRYEEAKKIMRQVIALDTTDSADIQFHYAEILAALGETFMAEVYYDKALKLGYDADTVAQRKAKLE